MSGLLSIALAAPANAQPDAVAAAESLFNRGLADMLAGRYPTGCPALTESHRLDPRPGRLFTLAECEAQWGRTATAVARYNDFLAMYSRMSQAKKFQQRERYRVALEQRDALAPLVPQLTLSLPSDAPAGTVVQCDGITLERPSLGIALPVNPGQHVVTTRAPGGPVHEVRFTIDKSESKTIELEVKLPAEDPPPGHAKRVDDPLSAPPASGPSSRRVVTYVAGGLAASGLIFGSVTGWMALSESSFAAERCTDAGSGVAECDHAGKAAGDRAKRLGLMSTIGFSAGAALAGAAVLLFLTEPSPSGPQAAAAARSHASAAPRPQAGAVSWSLLAGPTGGSVAVRSRW
ncbi:tetratricopeptide repeat protein [Sorangium sp. So ce1128]